jgi:phosphatidate cytidylyltransferase
MLQKRLFSSIVLVIVVVAGVFLDWVFNPLILAFTVLGLFEFFGMLEHKGIRLYKYFGIAVGTLIPLSIMWRFELTKKWELFFVVLVLLFLIVLQLKRREHTGVIVGISTTIFGILYVAWLFSFLVRIRVLPDGAAYLGSVLIITKLGDVGGFLIGSRFGRIPLIPRISPRKSVEGALGGLIFSMGGAVACKTFLPFSYLQLIWTGFFLGILGQLGDLSESLMKRDCHVKDSADIIPGMGGVLDIIDSLLFTAPVYYFYISIILKYIDL